MVDEGLTVLNQLWSGDLVVHHGTYYTVDNVRLQPVPVQRPRIPVWVGGESKAAFHRAGRWDGWIATGIAQDGSMTKTPEDMARSAAEIR
jgi:alkanesulfonate monooxygenase SsuD/methylene tetrahydromethanopterin reductase-like flavin-dependent oxidoreductase (luciferase family)